MYLETDSKHFLAYLFLVDDNISINKNVIEEKKLARLGLFPTKFC